jgi:nucleoside-diphosphate-sugar epimerase
MTVPSILEDAKNNTGLMRALIGLDFVAVGGGPIKPAIGELLFSNGVRLLNHYGATEIGAIAPIFVPGDDYDWHYLRIRTDMGLEIKEVGQKDESGVPFYQIVGYPFGWDHPFAIQDLLRRRPGSAHIEVAILGRNDDLLVLSTGEKVLPNQLEVTLSRQDGVKTAVLFGQNREEVGVLIEPEVPLHEDDVHPFMDRIWKVVQQENLLLDRHARVASKSMILLKSPEKILPRSDKGSVMRAETYKLFAKEIEEVYTSSGANDSFSFTLESHPDQIIRNLRSMVEICVQDRGLPVADWADSDDWFEQGMDSLEATRLARMLSRVSNKDSFPVLASRKAHPSFIYQYPSFKALSECLLEDTSNEKLSGSSSQSQLKQMLDLAFKYSPAFSRGWVVLLTGATGHLGVHLLDQLSRHTNVSQVLCLSRLHQGQNPKHRQQQANRVRGITLPESAWTKIRFLSSNQLHQPELGLPHEDYRRLVRTVTHIIHTAWPMDFQRNLPSFEPQIQTVRRLVDLCGDSHREQRRSCQPRLLFTSSIAVGARFASRRRLPEAPLFDPSATANMGYARAKWVCERILHEVAQTQGDLVHPIIVRLGQLTGGTHTGIWNSNEHFPAILKTSQVLGALPELDGVSTICVLYGTEQS